MSPFDIKSVVFHFDDFNYGRRSQPYFLLKIATQLVFFITYNKMKKYISHCRNSSTFKRKIVEICKFDIPNTHINDPSWLSAGTSIKSDGVKLVYSRFF